MSDSSISSKRVRRITVITDDGAETVYKNNNKKKRQSFLLKPMERVQRKMAAAMKTGAEEYLDRHESSNRKKKDGWIKDMPKNMDKANREMMKEARKALPKMG